MIRWAAVVLVTVAVVTSACGGDDLTRTTATTTATVTSTTPTTTPGATGIAEQAPEALRFTASLVGGGEVDLAGYAGRPVLLWFWAPY